MISMVNYVDGEDQLFYASPQRSHSLPEEILQSQMEAVQGSEASHHKEKEKKEDGKCLKLPEDARPPSPRPAPVFKRLHSFTSYMADGRKMSNGHVLEIKPPGRLWQELLLSAFIQKMESCEGDKARDESKQIKEKKHRKTGQNLNRAKSQSAGDLVEIYCSPNSTYSNPSTSAGENCQTVLRVETTS